MGVADMLVAFQAAHEDAAGAILFGEARFFDRLAIESSGNTATQHSR